MAQSKRIIITGGPGFGKTSIIRELQKRGYAVSDEKARIVIQKQMGQGSDKLPWEDVYGFSKLIIKEIVAEEIESDKPIFFDRGIPDVLAYLKNAGLEVDDTFYKKELKSMNYSNRVYFVPPWEEIYQVDNERKESLETAKEISDHIKRAYIEEGFELIEIKKDSVENRSDFILFDLALPQF